MFEKTSNPYKFKYLQTGISGPGIEQVYLPEPPPDKEIHFKKEQRFIRPELDKKIKKAIKILYAKKDPDGDDYDPDYVSPYQAEIDKWIDQQYERFEKGFWFWNNGVRTYLTPMHYAYLTEWVAYFGQPDYRETDKEICYWWAYIEGDKSSYGGLLNTIRRYGKSALMGFIIIWRTTRNFSHYSGMQGETDKKIKKFWDLHIIKPFRKMLAYMQPIYDYNSKQSEDIKFERPITRGKKSKIKLDDEDDFDDKEDLESYADYRESSEGAYDSAILHTYIMEEPGKCLRKGTLVKMYDGTNKAVEDVKIGDLLRGDDDIPRVVKRLGSGYGPIYKIQSNKDGCSWYVNEDHILSCKVSDERRFKGYKKGDVINISLEDYFKLNDDKKRHLMSYRVGVNYKEVNHRFDPYFLGIWLGDGDSNGHTITNEDQEIIDWLIDYGTKINGETKIIKPKNRATRIRIQTKTHYLTKSLKEYSLIKNKHIPNEFLIDSRANRLKLLAGIIDSDGHRNTRKNKPNSRSYEITQKNKRLIYDIKELCFSLGFYATVNEKTATMKRKDGTLYKCQVYRLSLYGKNLSEIPCLVSRKKMPEGLSNYNSKDPSIYGFTVNYFGEDYWYGFNISGNRLYLLSDYTVTHNTLSANVDERWSTVKPCLRKGATIRGKALLATTVEHMNVLDKGGKVYQKLFYESDFNKRTGIGQTISGLYAAFLPGDCAFEGFFDDHGHPLRAEARRSIILERESKKHNPKDYSALIRKYPLSTAEIFWVSSDQCVFNATILQERKLELDSSVVPMWTKFDLEWENKKRFSKIIIKHNPENGWYKSSWIFAKGDEYDKMANQVRKNPDGTYSPLNEEVFNSGIDPVDHRVVIQSRMGFGEDEFISTRRSKPVMLVKRRYDSSIDGPMGDHDDMAKRAAEKYQYQTGVYIGMMDSRPTDPNVMFERALMICWLHGMSMNVESAKPGVMNYFHAHGCSDFIKQKYVPESKSKGGYEGEGTPANSATINEYTDCLAWYIDYFGHTMPFVDVVNDLLIFDPANTKVHDYSVAMGWCELGEKIRPKFEKREMLNIEDIMPLFDRYGNLIPNRRNSN